MSQLPNETGILPNPPDAVKAESRAIVALEMISFRNYRRAQLHLDSPQSVVLFGHNGAGKTNILEALSLLAPGRGLRRAKLAECVLKDGQDRAAGVLGWTVKATLSTTPTPVEITARFRQSGAPQGQDGSDRRDRRTLDLDGEATTPGQLSSLMAFNWLTPAMDGLFLDGAGSRRRFFDRLIYGLDPTHAGRVNQYERSLRERRQLLAQSHADPVWLDVVEQRLAGEAIAVAAARVDCARLLADDMQALEDPFPRADLALRGDVETWLQQMPALDAEDRFQAQLRQNRQRDRALERTTFGPHLSDYEVCFADTGRAAKHCSTGEQKIMLAGLVLAHARALARQRGQRPILLLDDVVAHLDRHRRAYLAQALIDLGCQCWFTGADREAFSALEGRAQFFSVEQGHIQAC